MRLGRFPICGPCVSLRRPTKVEPPVVLVQALVYTCFVLQEKRSAKGEKRERVESATCPRSITVLVWSVMWTLQINSLGRAAHGQYLRLPMAWRTWHLIGGNHFRWRTLCCHEGRHLPVLPPSVHSRIQQSTSASVAALQLQADHSAHIHELLCFIPYGVGRRRIYHAT